MPFYPFPEDTVFGFWLLRVKIHVNGAQKLPEGPILFVENHRSNYDPLVTWHAFRRRRLAFVSKPSNFRIPFFGPLIRRCCFLAIDRENPRNAMQTILKAAKLMTEERMDVAIYPEGTRNKDKGLLPFHNGVFKIAQRANAPIAVLCVTGTENIHKRTPFRRTDVYLDVLEVLPAEQVKREKTEVIGAHVRDLLLKNIEEREHK
jgi:1-acyl-sn-glycerol-3-phosphate acyltransferase